jgi:hypothetical protein
MKIIRANPQVLRMYTTVSQYANSDSGSTSLFSRDILTEAEMINKKLSNLKKLLSIKLLERVVILFSFALIN